ncbi:MAG: hypothetical protein R3B45_02745 [Bdellovibrionota bacterium]
MKSMQLFSISLFLVFTTVFSLGIGQEGQDGGDEEPSPNLEGQGDVGSEEAVEQSPEPPFPDSAVGQREIAEEPEEVIEEPEPREFEDHDGPSYNDNYPQANMIEPSTDYGSGTSTDAVSNKPTKPSSAPPLPKKKVFSSQKKKEICRKYEGNYISYYGTIYFVKNCKRSILSSREVYYLTRKKGHIIEVDQDALIGMVEGKPFYALSKPIPPRGCKELDRKYVTYKFGDLYYVEGCKKHMFLDWGSFETHRVSISAKNANVLSLTWAEFSSLPVGKPMPSIILKEYVDLNAKARDVDIIPIDEACSGLNGHFVSYYSKIYKIERCHKRLADASLLSKHALSRSKTKLKELTSEQWISLPDGPPVGVQGD